MSPCSCSIMWLTRCSGSFLILRPTARHVEGLHSATFSTMSKILVKVSCFSAKVSPTRRGGNWSGPSSPPRMPAITSAACSVSVGEADPSSSSTASSAGACKTSGCTATCGGKVHTGDDKAWTVAVAAGAEEAALLLFCKLPCCVAALKEWFRLAFLAQTSPSSSSSGDGWSNRPLVQACYARTMFALKTDPIEVQLTQSVPSISSRARLTGTKLWCKPLWLQVACTTD